MRGVSEKTKVLFAPDWRAGNPYQRLLAEALAGHGVEVAFAPQTHGLFRLAKAARAVDRAGRFDLLHLHWPEAYFPGVGDRRDGARRVLFPLDLRLALAGRPLVYTGHNLHPHGSQPKGWTHRACRSVVRRADAILAHSAGSVGAYVREFGVQERKFRVIPHGDMSGVLPRPARGEARARLGLGGARLCLVFGAVDPYKGIEEILAAWRGHAPPDWRLAVVGRPRDASYAATLAALAAGLSGVTLKCGWVSEEEQADWMAACDVMLFNYRTILTSGSACQARAMGIPLALPARLSTVDLMEPDPAVVRFPDAPRAMMEAIQAAAGAGASWERAAPYRAETAWVEVARRTAEAYRALLKT